MTASPDAVASLVHGMLGRHVPEGSEAWACAVESLEHAAEADRPFGAAGTMPVGDERTDVLQRAHDAMRDAASWEEAARHAAERVDG